MKYKFFFLTLMIILSSAYVFAENNMNCNPLEQQGTDLHLNCYEIKTSMYNTSGPKINVTFQEEVTVTSKTLYRIGNLDFDLEDLEENYFQNYTWAFEFDLEELENGLYQPLYILSDGLYVFRIKGFNVPNIYIDTVVFFKINASQMNFWVTSPANHSIPKPSFAASEIQFTDLIIETERSVEGCKYAINMAPGQAQHLYENEFGDSFQLIDSTTLKIPNFDFNSGFHEPNSAHSFKRLEVVCKEETPGGAPSKYSYQRLYNVYIPNAPIITTTPQPSTIIDYANAYSMLNVITQQTTSCFIQVEPLPQGIQGANPIYKYTTNYVFNKLDYYLKEKDIRINVSHRPSPYNFELNVTCTNLANLSSSITTNIITNFSESADFKFITPGTYANNRNINVSGAFITGNETCRAKFNEEQTQTILDYKQLITSGIHNGRHLYQKIVTGSTTVLQEGINTVHVNCDLMPPEQYDSKTFILDTKPPTNMTIDADQNSCSLTQVKATLSAQDENGIDYFEYELISQAKPEFNRNGTSTGLLTISYPSSQSNQLENVTFTLRTRAIDNAGNTGSWTQKTIKMTSPNIIECDFTPPTINIQSTYNETLNRWLVDVSCLDTHSGCRPGFTWGSTPNMSETCNYTKNIASSLNTTLEIEHQGRFCAEVSDMNDNKASRTITLTKPTNTTQCTGICGGDCPACAIGQICTENSDCLSNYCLNGICAVASCTDGIKNGFETGIDCGGPSCPACEIGASCLVDADCDSKNCLDNVCHEASCNNNKQDGDETDIDCGGSCEPCALNKQCKLNSDCAEGECINGSCKIPPEPPITEPEKKANLLGVIFLILGIVLIIAGGVLLFLENKKKKEQESTMSEARDIKASLNPGMPKVTTLDEKPQIKSLTKEEMALRKKAWENSMKERDQKRREILSTFETDSQNKPDTKPATKIESTESKDVQSKNNQSKTETETKEKSDNKPDDKVIDKSKEKPATKTETKEKPEEKSATKKEKKESKETKNKDDEDFFEKLKEINKKNDKK